METRFKGVVHTIVVRSLVIIIR